MSVYGVLLISSTSILQCYQIFRIYFLHSLNIIAKSIFYFTDILYKIHGKKICFFFLIPVICTIIVQ